MISRINRIAAWFGPILLAGAALAAYAKIIHDHLVWTAPDAITIRLCHWQLEPGFREAMQDLMDRYAILYRERTGQRIQFLQIPINGRVYGQYVNCSLIGRVAPDLVEMGRGQATSAPGYVARFFEPLGDLLKQPNPYNAGTKLADIPWQETFSDALAGNYESSLLEFYSVPMTRSTLRFFYNRDLYRKITGLEKPPATFAQFQAFFENVTAYNQRFGTDVFPIAASSYQLTQLSQLIGLPFRADLVLEHDLNFDGKVDKLESYVAFRRGSWNFETPALEAMIHCLADVARGFQPGWQAALRDDALFQFLQERGVMITSGAWDARVIPRLAEGKFQVGVFAAPVPTDHPYYGKFVKGPRNEAATPGGVGFGVNANSLHKEIAMDFLRFITSIPENEQFCWEMGWTPVIRDALPAPEVAPFQPVAEGFTGDFDLDISAEVLLKGNGLRSGVVAGRIPFETYAVEMNALLDRSASPGFFRNLQQNKDRIRNSRRILAGELGEWSLRAAKGEEKLRERATTVLLDEGWDLIFRELAAQASNEKGNKP